MPTAEQNALDKLEAIFARRDKAMVDADLSDDVQENFPKETAAHRKRVAMRQARDKGEMVASSLKDRAKQKLGKGAQEAPKKPAFDPKQFEDAQRRYVTTLAELGAAEGIPPTLEGLKKVEQGLLSPEKRLELWQASAEGAMANVGSPEGQVDTMLPPKYHRLTAPQPQPAPNRDQLLRQQAAARLAAQGPQIPASAGSVATPNALTPVAGPMDPLIRALPPGPQPMLPQPPIGPMNPAIRPVGGTGQFQPLIRKLAPGQYPTGIVPVPQR